MQRVGDEPRHAAVRLDGRLYVERLERDFDEVEIEVFEDSDFPKPGRHHVVGGGVFAVRARAFRQRVDAVAVARQAARLADSAHRRQAAEVHPYAYRDIAPLRLADDSLHLLAVAYVAGVQAQAVHAALQRLQRQLIVEVDVRHKRDGDSALDFRQRLRRLHVGNRRADDFATGFLQTANLADGGVDVPRVRLGHGLHRNRRVPADFDVSDV